MFAALKGYGLRQCKMDTPLTSQTWILPEPATWLPAVPIPKCHTHRGRWICGQPGIVDFSPICPEFLHATADEACWPFSSIELTFKSFWSTDLTFLPSRYAPSFRFLIARAGAEVIAPIEGQYHGRRVRRPPRLVTEDAESLAGTAPSL